MTEADYDYFFNSPFGYRGQFAVSPNRGSDANEKLLTALESPLERFALVRGEQDTEKLVWSLRAPDAKIWIDEEEVQTQLGRTLAEIIYEPWQRSSDTGVGLLAPVGTLLEVKGGWLDGNGVARNNPAKAGRAEEIFATGYS